MKTSSTLLLFFVAILVVAGGIFLMMNKSSPEVIGQTVNTQPAPNPISTQPPVDTQVPEASTPTPTTASPSSASTSNVVIQRLEFSPATLTIHVGDTVIWTNLDPVAHDIVSISGNEMNSPTLGKGQSYSHTFTTQGTYDYHSSISQYMTGEVIVVA